MFDRVDPWQIPSATLPGTGGDQGHGGFAEVHPVHVGTAFAAVMIAVQHINPPRRDHGESTTWRDRLHDRGFHVCLTRREPSSARLVYISFSQSARPQVVEPAILNQHCNRAIVFIIY